MAFAKKTTKKKAAPKKAAKRKTAPKKKAAKRKSDNEIRAIGVPPRPKK